MSKIKKIKQLVPLKSNAELQKIITNIGWLFVDKLLRLGGGLFISIWMARYLEVAQFGILNYATAFVALFLPIATLGLDTIVVHQLINVQANKNKILGTTFWLRLFSSLISAFGAIIGIALIRKNDHISASIVMVLSIASMFQAFDTIDLWFQSQVNSKYTVVTRNISFVLASALRIFLITAQAPLIMFAWAVLLEVGVNALGLIIAYQVNGASILKWQWDFVVAKSLLHKSLPLIFSGLAIMVYLKIDQIMLGEMIDDHSVGIYSVASRISEVWYFIPMAISSSVSPAIYKAKEISETLYYRRIGQLHRLLIVISISLALPMTFLSKPLVVALFGNAYAEAGAILSIHIWASIFVFMGVATTAWFIAESLTLIAMYKTILGAVVNIILNLFLIPKYSGAGAAVATVISYAVAGLISHAIFPRTRKIFHLQIRSLLMLKI
jgi:polysaccharide transporter, PST family